ncbi:MAG: hypothetical protein J1E58_00875 [Prevotella sp.]|nr:hypothetical protein [Prevotella sp.]
MELLNAPFRLESDEEQLIRTRLRPPCKGDPVKLMNAATICQLLNGGHIGHPLSSRKVAAAMRKLGFPDCHTRRGTFFRVFEIPYGSIQSALAAEVSEEESVTE